MSVVDLSPEPALFFVSALAFYAVLRDTLDAFLDGGLS